MEQIFLNAKHFALIDGRHRNLIEFDGNYNSFKAAIIYR
jgi:hypothetical protein